MDDEFNPASWNADPTSHNNPNSYNDFQDTDDDDIDAGIGSSSGAAAGYGAAIGSSSAGPSEDRVVTERDYEDYGVGQEDESGGNLQGKLVTTVSDPTTESEGTKDAFVSYLVATETDFATFQKKKFAVRRRFTDFVFLYKTLTKDFPQCAVPPLPDKHKMEYVRGDRFGPDFTNRRAHSLHRFLKRLTLHPILRRAALLVIFLESSDWNATMRLRPAKVVNNTEAGSGGLFEGLTDTFVNAFTKVHKPDERFIKTLERADKLDEDLGHVEKIIARVVRREVDLEADYSDLSSQFNKILDLEPELKDEIDAFATAAQDTSGSIRKLREHTDQDYLISLKDMESYIVAIKSLLKAREQKQLDFEALSDYLSRATYDREQTLTAPAGLASAGNFLTRKLEDVRGVDHEQVKRDKLRKLENRIETLTKACEEARREAECFDDASVKEVADFERIKLSEMKDTLGDFAQANIDFYRSIAQNWETMVEAFDRSEAERKERAT
ncbi:hypothetical protein BJ508DRAFT_122292 [Ascobolus immersus RN42]|uniref:Sorting nexin-4 n=1 Tax=Ascobolus immersus RN42 TaxID=1160509 RepID=A0A3N4IQC3_ASCIM|nr:hypothetical protein BJ508DRAFT_122292 [Ascobolus immersus RN42]